jgi:PE family
MTGTDVLRMQTGEVLEATRQLDQLAGRAEDLMQKEAPNLTVIAAGRDEVSQRVASNLNVVHSDFGEVADRGTNQLRDIAATLRAHTDNIVAAEQDFAV